MENNRSTNPDIVLIGAGIMSATLGMMLKELEPGISIVVLERLDSIAAESSDAWNNAGTGHSALCELNYTPQLADGSIDCSKAIQIHESFELSKQFWAYLVQKGYIASPNGFINSVPHMSFVWGEENVDFLHKRCDALGRYHFFKGMQYSEDHARISQWIPLMMEGRDPSQIIAATRMDTGTDVNFGALTKNLFQALRHKENVSIQLNQEVRDLERDDDGHWRISIRDRMSGDKYSMRSPFVFIGAGGGSLPLLEKSGIPEGRGFGGFPVSGQWLKCNNEEIIERHYAKVYGKAATGSPPMSVPHLDTRMIDGKRALFFGPYAGFSTKFLKHGSYLDLPLSIKYDNILPMLQAGWDNIPLTRYLIDQVRQSPEERLDALREFYPHAQMGDWELEVAGQRVQVIKKDPGQGGILEFGTEMVCAADGSIAALLGASPGASTAVAIMLDLLPRSFKQKAASAGWQARLKEMIPSYEQSLAKDQALSDRLRQWTNEMLDLQSPVYSL